MVADETVRAAEALDMPPTGYAHFGFINAAVIAVQHIEDQTVVFVFPASREGKAVEGTVFRCRHFAADALFVQRNGIVAGSCDFGIMQEMRAVVLPDFDI